VGFLASKETRPTSSTSPTLAFPSLLAYLVAMSLTIRLLYGHVTLEKIENYLIRSGSNMTSGIKFIKMWLFIASLYLGSCKANSNALQDSVSTISAFVTVIFPALFFTYLVYEIICEFPFREKSATND
jgi:hypothetical protein